MAIQPLVIEESDLYALIGKQQVELLLLRNRVAQLEAAAQGVNPNGKGKEEERQAEGQAAKGQ